MKICKHFQPVQKLGTNVLEEPVSDMSHQSLPHRESLPTLQAPGRQTLLQSFGISIFQVWFSSTDTHLQSSLQSETHKIYSFLIFFEQFQPKSNLFPLWSISIPCPFLGSLLCWKQTLLLFSYIKKPSSLEIS